MRTSESIGVTVLILICVSIPFALIGSCMRYWPEYSVWQQGKVGEAELKRAEQNRQIKIEEAKSALEAAKLLSDAEVQRAKGVAEANEIMVKSLGTPENYLRWRYITMLEESGEKGRTDREVIYIPVDGLLPMTEAGRAVRKPQ